MILPVDVFFGVWHFFDLAVLGANNGFETNATRHFRSKCATQQFL